MRKRNGRENMKTIFKSLLYLTIVASTFGLFALYLLESAQSIMAEEGGGILPVAAFLSAAGVQNAAGGYRRATAEHMPPRPAKLASPTHAPTPAPTPPPTPAPAPTPVPGEPEASPIGQWRAIERPQSYNEELQYYSPGNVVIWDDGVILSARIEVRGDKSYTSGMVESNACFLYGRFSFTIRVPEGKGLFPAIWFLPVEDKPRPEIDVFEMIGSEPDTFYGVLHYLEGESRQRAYFSERVEPQASYVIGLVWTPEELSWYIDGICVLTREDNIPDEPMYLIINMAVGGVWPGTPDEETVFPANFIVEAIDIDADWSGAR